MNGQYELGADFYDDDEPVEKIRAAFRRSERPVVTKPTNVVEGTTFGEPADSDGRWVFRVPAESAVQMEGVTWDLSASPSGRPSFKGS